MIMKVSSLLFQLFDIFRFKAVVTQTLVERGRLERCNQLYFDIARIKEITFGSPNWSGPCMKSW